MQDCLKGEWIHAREIAADQWCAMMLLGCTVFMVSQAGVLDALIKASTVCTPG